MKLTLPVVVAATGGVLLDPNQSTSSFGSQLFPVNDDSPSTRLAGAVLAPAASTLTFEKVVYDSREVLPGTLFVALPGEVTDGHNYLSEAIAKGATACLVARSWLEQQSSLNPAIAWIVAEETLPAFQKLAAWWRNQFQALEVLGITGSVGKTSTKELISAVLEQRYQVFKSPKSVNTEQSLLPVLLRLSPQDQVAVIEMGAGYVFGELERLCSVAKPRIGIVLNVSHSHLGRMGSLENIARNKSELVRSLPSAAEGGIAILNGDDVRVKAMYTLTQARPFFYGTQPEFDLWASEIETFGLQGLAFTANYQGQTHRINLPLLGKHSVYTALAAIAAGLLLGLSWQAIETGLNQPEAQVRLLVLAGLNGSTIIDDSYNASAVSTVAALDLLADVHPTSGSRKIAALGDMLELGVFEEEAHRIVGRRAAQVADLLIVVGALGRIIGEEAIRQGLASEKVQFAADTTEAANFLQTILQSGDYLLVKASRGARLDEVVSKVRAVD